MIYLDCESLETTIESLAKIYQIEYQKIEDFLKNIVIDEQPEFPEKLRIALERELGCEPQEVDRICWFHFTGNLLKADYLTSGLRPTHRVLDDIWESLFSIFSENQERLVRLRDLHVNQQSGSRYWSKIEYINNLYKIDAGPHAMLVRNVSPGSDFLKMPEIALDICFDLEIIYGESISDIVESHCTPTIVKFWSVENKKRTFECINVAVFYAHEALRDLKFTDTKHTCFDGKNEIVPPDRIISVKPA